MNTFRKYLLSSVVRLPDGDGAPGASPASPAGGGGGADAAPVVAPAAEAAAVAAATMLDAPSLLTGASAAKPDAKAADAKAAETKTETKSSPTDAANPAEGEAAAGAKTQDASSEAPAKADTKAEAKAEGDKPKPDAAKAQEPAKDAAKEGEKPAEPVAPVPVAYEAFKVSEHVKLDDARVKEFTDIIGPRQLPQEDAQKLVDLFDKSAQDLATHMRQEQRKTWNGLNDTWKTESRDDPEIGGNRFQTSLAMAKAVIEEFLTPDQQKRYLGHLDLNGMSNFPEHIRLLAKIGEALNVFEDKIVAPNAPNPGVGKGGGFRRNYKNSGNGVTT